MRRLPEKPPLPTLDDLRESVKLWTQEIAAKCRTCGMPADVVLVVRPRGEAPVVRATGDSIAQVREMLRAAETDLAVREMTVGGPKA